MIAEKSLVVYKNHPALVTGTGEKIEISLYEGPKTGFRQYRVREKDVEALYPGPCGPADLEKLENMEAAGDNEEGALTGNFTGLPSASGGVRDAWELLEGAAVPLRDLAELVYGEYTAGTIWAAWRLLKDGLYFSGSIDALNCRTAGEVEAEEKRRAEKQRETEDREFFLEWLKARLGDKAGKDRADERLNDPRTRRFFQDAEALALGKTGKSRTLRDLGKPETPQDAHRLLMDAGFWTPFVNPYPSRYGLSLSQPKFIPPAPPPDEERLDLTHLNAYAIDNAWSADPDDAVSWEDGCLYVHVADPAASVLPGSPGDREARDRGATLYLPEGPFRMIAGEALPLFALGLAEVSPALSFKLILNEDLSVAGTDIARSWVKVTRLTYGEADKSPELSPLFDLAARALKRRLEAGAVNIELPEAHIAVSQEEITIEPVEGFRSADMVRECMLLAGEGAGRWALSRGLPFPYISQEPGDIPKTPLPGMAGSYQLRRCMRPRTVSVKPGSHWGLGLDIYTQVTSPLRRYTDLLAHQQIRAVLRGEAPLGEDEILLRLAASETAAVASVHAERASRTHWTAVYLADKKGSPWDGVVMEKKGPRAAVLIPALGLETQVPLKEEKEPNAPLRLILSSVKIPEGEINFVLP
jgi:exoribonuclease-2